MPHADGFELIQLGETAITIRWQQTASATQAAGLNEQAVRRSRDTARMLRRAGHFAIREVTFAYQSVTVHYDPLLCFAKDTKAAPYQQIAAWIREVIAASGERAETDASSEAVETIRIPVCYGGVFGPDLSEVAAALGRSENEVAELHSSAVYTVAMIGFAPGFPYLAGMPEQLAVPRKSEPRLSVEAGSVGIAGAQTGIYPQQSPGGWQLIGRTPLRLFHPLRTPPSLLEPGDQVRFAPISEAEFEALLKGGRQVRRS